MNYLQLDAERIRSFIPPEVNIPPRAEGLFLLYAVLLRSKGAAVSSSDAHDAWSAWATMEQESHASIVLYDDLTDSVQQEDAPFVAAIRLAAQGR
ncbi:DUF7701 domain-containing protein [Streptomyces hokutonensis]|uniref:DUF7701 domain-containing protein n=1 Tax=Streptomyces hokutonensis TaxID=1306990 RepID=UPI0006865B29|nr:hypothetical protein [Streptomyces hokutonensis]